MDEEIKRAAIALAKEFGRILLEQGKDAAREWMEERERRAKEGIPDAELDAAFDALMTPRLGLSAIEYDVPMSISSLMAMVQNSAVDQGAWVCYRTEPAESARRSEYMVTRDWTAEKSAQGWKRLSSVGEFRS